MANVTSLFFFDGVFAFTEVACEGATGFKLSYKVVVVVIFKKIDQTSGQLVDYKFHEFYLPLHFSRTRYLLFWDFFHGHIYLVDFMSTHVNVASVTYPKQCVTLLILDFVKVVKLIEATGLLKDTFPLLGLMQFFKEHANVQMVLAVAQANVNLV